MLSIKNAGLSDLPLIKDMAYQIWPVTYGEILSQQQMEYMLDKFYSLSSLQNQLVNSKHYFILLIDEDTPVGYASFSPKEKGTGYHLHKIYILPQQQGKGAGKFLLLYIINYIKSLQATSLSLNVNRHNKAVSFYKKQGFIIDSEEDIDIGNNFFMNDYIMKLAFPQ